MIAYHRRIVSLLAIFAIIFLPATFCFAEEGFVFPEDETPLTPPELSDDFFPCSSCHESIEVNTERYPLEDMHEDISELFDSGKSKHPWCLSCHDAVNRDMLKLSDGKLISFEDSFLLCGQCHGEQFRKWKQGLHGKRTGHWNGQKSVLLCAHCHSAHLPKFKSLKPLPPPDRPGPESTGGKPPVSHETKQDIK